MSRPLPDDSRRAAVRQRTARGFTLLEILAVTVIIGLLTAVALPRFLGRLDASRRDQARLTLERIRVALEMYREDQGRYPTTRQGLSALWRKPETGPQPAAYPQRGYLPEGLPADPWGREFSYEAERDGRGPFALRCLGADGLPGGTGRNADIILPD